MKIYTHLDSDDTAYATLQMSAAEFTGIREYMHTPDQFDNVKFPNGVYLNKAGRGWYDLTTSNDFVARKKIETALVLIRKIDRHMREKNTSSDPRPTGAPYAVTSAEPEPPKIFGLAVPRQVARLLRTA
jgi:hypothetical protein